MQLNVGEAHRLAVRIMSALGHDAADSSLIADHLIDCELRGLSYGGLARAISIAERMARTGDRRRPIRIGMRRRSQCNSMAATISATSWRIAPPHSRSRRHLPSASRWSAPATPGTPACCHIMPRSPRRRGLVSMIASNASPWVAPFGATEGRFGTNPICFGFPSADEPVIWDIGTSAIIHAEVTLAKRLGQPLPAGVAFDRDGQPTRDPVAALAGAFAAWGGHKGSGLGIVVQLLGIMAGSAPIPAELAGFGFVMVAMRPDLLGPAETFRDNVSAYAQAVRTARPVAGGEAVRMPFDRSRQDRRHRLAADRIDIPDVLFEQLTRIAEDGPAGTASSS